MSAPPPVAMRVVEMAARYGVSRATVWRWARRGLVLVERVGPRAGVRVRLRPPKS
jgi:DNA-binding transcriptional MerR regulator